MSLSDSFGSALDFVRGSSRTKKPFLRDIMGPGRFGRITETDSGDTSLVETNGGKPLEMQLRLQSQQEELSRMQQEQAKLREELAGQKVRPSHSSFPRVGALKAAEWEGKARRPICCSAIISSVVLLTLNVFIVFRIKTSKGLFSPGWTSACVQMKKKILRVFTRI